VPTGHEKKARFVIDLTTSRVALRPPLAEPSSPNAVTVTGR
jgi:hypothetical protein